MRGATRIPRGRPLGAGAKLGAALALGLPACGGGDGADGLSVVVDTVGGVEHVTSFGPGTWADEGGGWWLDEGASTEIGAVEGPDEVVFGRISGVLVDPEGRIHVADPQAREVRVFSPDGGFLRRVGRDGEGPGEFRHLSGLALAPDGVAALDGSLGRVTVFDGSGQVVRTFRLERPYMILEHFAAMGFDREGRFLDRARLSLRPGTDSIGVAAYNPHGRPAGTAFLAEIRQDHVMLERDGLPFMSIPRPFAPQVSLAFGPEGTVYLARGGEYRIEAFSPDGEPLHVVHRPVEPAPVTAAERDSALAFVERVFEDQGGSLPRGVELPERKPAIGRLVVDSGGRLWVLTGTGGGGDRLVWAVHAPGGRFLGTVSTPPMAVTQIGEDFLAGATTDELGVQRAVVIPLRKGARPAGDPGPDR